MCVSCGFDGRDLQGERGQARIFCPRCGADLYSRRPRSYAELEGLAPAPADEWVRAGRGLGPRTIVVSRPCRATEQALYRWRAIAIAMLYVAAAGAGFLTACYLAGEPWMVAAVAWVRAVLHA